MIVEPRWRTWSHREPVTVFGASGMPVWRGWDEVSTLVGFEHKTGLIDGRTVTYTLRVTHVYRREDGVWKTVHRHGDHVDKGKASS